MGTFALRYLDELDGLVIRDIHVDITSGEIIASSMQDHTFGWNVPSASRGAELVWHTRGLRNCVYEASTE